MTGIQARPEDDSYTKNYSIPAAAYTMTIKPTSLADGKHQLENALQQTPTKLSIDCSLLNWSDKINMFNWVARTYAAIYDNVQPEFALPQWSVGVARWSAAVWKLNYYTLEAWTNANCPSIIMSRLNYTQGYSFSISGGPAWEEYCDRYLSGLDNMTDYQKAVYIADLVCDQVQYDYEALNSGSKYQLAQANNIENFLTTNDMCCLGYARIYQALCLRAGLQCYEIVGYAAGYCHAWNAVVVGNKLMQIDCCWYDTGSAFKSIIAFGALKNHYADVRYTGTLNYAV